MADVKISALPAASTPLAGTEVLPIVQGGITEKVSVANLTAGRDVSVNSLIVTSNITINGNSVVDQTDIGTAPNEIPLNQYLGNLAYQNSNAVVLNPVASAVPTGIGDMVFQLTNNTTLVVKVKGSDGTVRSVTLTLA